jgi:hypothetical protein
VFVSSIKPIQGSLPIHRLRRPIQYRGVVILRLVHDEERNDARKSVAYAWQQAENSVPAKADVSARNQELVIHEPAEELNLVEPLLGVIPAVSPPMKSAAAAPRDRPRPNT